MQLSENIKPEIGHVMDSNPNRSAQRVLFRLSPRSPDFRPSLLRSGSWFVIFHPVLQDWIEELQLRLLSVRDGKRKPFGFVYLKRLFIRLE